MAGVYQEWTGDGVQEPDVGLNLVQIEPAAAKCL